MSMKALTWAFAQPLAGNHKVVLLVLADGYCDERQLCYPSVAYIADKAFVSRATAFRVIGELEMGGYLKREERSSSEGRRMTTIYRLPVGVDVSRRPPLSVGGSQIETEGEGLNGETPGGLNAETPYEPSYEPTGRAVALPVGGGGKPKPEKRTPSKGSRLPDDFAPSPASLAKAQELGLDDGTLRRELEKFTNYWASKPGRDATKIDWQRTLQNWLITAAERTPHGTRRQEPPRRGQTVRESLDIVNAAIDTELARYAAARPREADGEYNPVVIPGR